MKAVVYRKYGQPDVLKFSEVEQPSPGNNEVLIQVHASSVNDWDWALISGKPFIIRLLYGLFKPGITIPGTDVAGRIITVGRNVKQFKPGDDVIGDLSVCGFGSFAEYVCVPEQVLTLKPSDMTFEEAAAIPHTSTLALQGLNCIRHNQDGQKVLINGAGGSAGTYAVQMAKLFGAEVTGVDSTDKLDTMISIGADFVIDYTKEDFTLKGFCYDLIIDFAVHHPITNFLRAMNPGGIYLAVGGSSFLIAQIFLFGPLISFFTKKKMSVLMHKPNMDLAYIIDLIESGKIVSVIDRHYRLSETAEAIQYYIEARVKGKAVITMDEYL